MAFDDLALSFIERFHAGGDHFLNPLAIGFRRRCFPRIRGRVEKLILPGDESRRAVMLLGDRPGVVFHDGPGRVGAELHAAIEVELGITNAQLRLSQYANDRWTEEATALLRSAFALPNNPDFGKYDALVWKGLTAAWSGDVTPQQAADTVVKEIRATMADKVIIR